MKTSNYQNKCVAKVDADMMDMVSTFMDEGLALCKQDLIRIALGYINGYECRLITDGNKAYIKPVDPEDAMQDVLERINEMKDNYGCTVTVTASDNIITLTLTQNV